MISMCKITNKIAFLSSTFKHDSLMDLIYTVMNIRYDTSAVSILKLNEKWCFKIEEKIIILRSQKQLKLLIL